MEHALQQHLENYLLQVVGLMWLVHDLRAGHGGADAALVASRKADGRITAAYRASFIIFLLYPMLSRYVSTMRRNCIR